MSLFFLTAYDGSILGPIAKGLGWIMDKIYLFFSNVCHIESIILTIIVFTVIVYMCMFPLTYKQQKFSTLSRKMQPEQKAIQEKYKNKKDQASQMAMQEETQALYDKYGISPTGSCGWMIIQMPIFFALYRVFYNIPAYITAVKDIFSDLVSGVMATDGYTEIMQSIYEANRSAGVVVDFTSTDVKALSNYIIDVSYKLSDSGWQTMRDSFPHLTSTINAVTDKLLDINYLFMLNISDQPWNLMKTGASTRNYAMVICALLIPIVSYLTQLMSIKTVPQADSGNDQMAQQMKTMNTMMPLFSLFICFTVPVGLGVYWIISAFVRVIQQILLNKHFEKIDLNEIIEANREKAEIKKAKRKDYVSKYTVMESATMNTKQTMAQKAGMVVNNEEILENAAKLRENASENSLSAKANLVKQFNEKNNK